MRPNATRRPPLSLLMTCMVCPDGKLVVLTPIDPLFVLLPLLIALSPIDPFAPTTSADVGRFESFDTMFDRAPTIWVSSADSGLSIDPKDVEAFTSFPFVRSTVARCCDTLEGGGDMFRLSKDKVLIALAQKVVRIVQSLEAAQAAIKAAVPEGKATQEEEQGYSGPRPLLVRLVEKEEGMGDVAGVPEAVMKGEARLERLPPRQRIDRPLQIPGQRSLWTSSATISLPLSLLASAPPVRCLT